ncbi:peptidoglycan-binding protein [Nocardiopsis sediminis]|uniref:Peptidoglycan-binding protein n=1 Tax=Nocardiopsis sediminis TaxID=1778267 RepID=A0ABV8FU81_9ACTN
MDWRLARSLEVLRTEVNTIAPERSKKEDGTIGDAAHATRPSDHNPNAAGVVCAMDLTNDPGAGADMDRLSVQLSTFNHPAVKYVIWNRRIWSKERASEGWRPYTGANPHDLHMHVSVGVGPSGQSTGPYDDTSPWGIAAGSAQTGDGDMVGLRQGDTGERVKFLQELLVKAGHSVGAAGIDGDYGTATTNAVIAAREAEGSAEHVGDHITGAAAKQIMSQFIKAHAA